jgi:hypothetical protein
MLQSGSVAGVFVTEDAAGTGHFRELGTAHDLPVSSVPLGKDTRGHEGITTGFGGMFAVVRVNEDTLTRKHSLPVVTGQVSLGSGGFVLLVTVEGVHGECFHVDLVESLLH